MQLSSFIRDTVSLVQKDEEDQASDLATCFAFIFRSDFSNTVLPAQFYLSLNADLGIATPSFKLTTQLSSSSTGAASSLVSSDLDIDHVLGVFEIVSKFKMIIINMSKQIFQENHTTYIIPISFHHRIH